MKASHQIDDHPSPIARVHDDILIMVFVINSNMDDDETLDDHQRITHTTLRAINTTRRSSQVNSLWRRLIITSSVLWGNLIDIPFLDHAGAHWREEVIRRTKISPLHVKGNIYIDSLEDTGSWLSDFLNHSWHRIRNFDIAILTDRRSDSVITSSDAASYRKTLSCLSKPADYLESFKITFPRDCDPLESGAMLFSGRAPRLVSFETRCMILPLIQNSSWLPQLHCLQVFECLTPIFSSVDALYQVLAQMKHLQHLSLEDAIANPTIGLQRYPIHLPNLQKIQIQEDGRQNYLRAGRSAKKLASWTLLNSIIPKIGCSIDLRLKPLDIGDIDIPLLCRLAKNYFGTHQPRNIELGSGLKSFWLLELDLTTDELPTDGPFFGIRLDTQAGNISMADKTIYRLFQEMSFLTFPRVTKMCFMISTSHSTAFSDPKFGRLLGSLSSMETLSATSPALSAICSSPFGIASSSSALFPRLKVLEVPDFRKPSEYDMNRPLSEILSSFLKLQSAAGSSISTVSYKSDFEDGSFALQNLSCLDKFPGLKVVWNTTEIGSGEYVCGGGKPEELNLANKAREARPSRSRPYVYQIWS